MPSSTDLQVAVHQKYPQLGDCKSFRMSSTRKRILIALIIFLALSAAIAIPLGFTLSDASDDDELLETNNEGYDVEYNVSETTIIVTDPELLKCEKLPDIDFGNYSCSYEIISGSVCVFTCTQNHILEGVSTLSCAKGNWSDESPSCVCTDCSVGDNCEHSNKVAPVIAAARNNKVVVYGGRSIRCKTRWSVYSWEVVWRGTCTDINTGTSANCPRCERNQIKSSDTAARDAARELIRKMVNSNDYPHPCDPENL